MSDENDRLSNEVSAVVKVEGSGLSLSAKSRALSAFDRFIGSLFDIPTSKLEGAAERIRERNKRKMAEIRGASGLSVIEAMAISQVQLEGIQAQENKKAVADQALEDLITGKQAVETSETVSDEWISFFEIFARNASTERLRMLWGKVLSGEIKNPGQFSTSTIRLLSEIDFRIASLFQEHTTFRIADRFLIRPKNLKGQLAEDYMFLEEAGLLNGVSSATAWQINRSPEGLFFFREGEYVLTIAAIDDRQLLDLGVIPITRAGRQIASIFPLISEIPALHKLADYFADEAKSIEINRVLSEPNERQITMTIIEKIK